MHQLHHKQSVRNKKSPSSTTNIRKTLLHPHYVVVFLISSSGVST
jgi:hypothetical protein